MTRGKAHRVRELTPPLREHPRDQNTVVRSRSLFSDEGDRPPNEIRITCMSQLFHHVDTLQQHQRRHSY